MASAHLFFLMVFGHKVQKLYTLNGFMLKYSAIRGRYLGNHVLLKSLWKVLFFQLKMENTEKFDRVRSNGQKLLTLIGFTLQ